MRRVTRLAVRLYPAAWRERYEAEFLDLIRAEPSSLRVFTDVVMHGLRARASGWRSRHLSGDSLMFALDKHARRSALIGLALTLPTALLISASVLKYVVGIAGPFDAIEPTITPIVTHPIGETFITLAPYAALLLAAIPVTRLGFERRDGRLGATIRIAAPPINLMVASMSVLLAVFMVLYWVAENL